MVVEANSKDEDEWKENFGVRADSLQVAYCCNKCGGVLVTLYDESGLPIATGKISGTSLVEVRNYLARVTNRSLFN